MPVFSRQRRIAGAAYSGTPSIATYVIGVGQLLTSLNQFARAGGTGQAFIIDTSANGTKQFIDAMYSIRVGQGLPCDYALPTADDGGAVDPGMVNLDYRPGPDRSKVVPLSQVRDVSQCAVGKLGWFYDAAGTARRLRLCDQTCSEIKPDIHGEVRIHLPAIRDESAHVDRFEVHYARPGAKLLRARDGEQEIGIFIAARRAIVVPHATGGLQVQRREPGNTIVRAELDAVATPHPRH